jgi:hypothetical protein
MADTVDTITQFSGKNRLLVRIANISDGTGESAVVKVDKSTLTNAYGLEPAKLIVMSIHSMVQGFSSIRLYWDHTTDDELAILPAGIAYRDFTEAGGLADPGSAGGTGDIILTTAGAVSGATYDILLDLLLSGNV